MYLKVPSRALTEKQLKVNVFIYYLNKNQSATKSLSNTNILSVVRPIDVYNQTSQPHHHHHISM